MSSEHDNSVDDDFLCCSAGSLCENELTLRWSELNAFIERHDINLSDTVSVNYTRSDIRAGAIESSRVDEFDVSDPAGGSETLDDAYQAVSDDTEKTIQNALTDLVEDPAVVDDVLDLLC